MLIFTTSLFDIVPVSFLYSLGFIVYWTLLPARASEQGNVIGSVHIIYIYIYVCVQKKFVIGI